MSRNDIYTIQGEDYKQMAIRILQAADVAADIGDRGRRVGIKPNILAAKKASTGAVTHPELVDGVLTYLKEAGFRNLVVLEGSWIGDLTCQAVRVCGIYDICKKHQVPFLDLQKDSFQTLDAAGMPISVCSEACALDYLINMPVLKGHNGDLCPEKQQGFDTEYRKTQVPYAWPAQTDCPFKYRDPSGFYIGG